MGVGGAQCWRGALSQLPFPTWACSGKYDGPEAPRLAALRLAATLGVAYVDIELKVATVFFAGALMCTVGERGAAWCC